jgi:hypothetical protein
MNNLTCYSINGKRLIDLLTVRTTTDYLTNGKQVTGYNYEI